MINTIQFNTRRLYSAEGMMRGGCNLRKEV